MDVADFQLTDWLLTLSVCWTAYFSVPELTTSTGLCGYGYRFNEFYSDQLHPFAHQMGENLAEAGRLSLRTTIENKLRVYSAQQYQANTDAMVGLCRELIEDRKKNPQPDRHDLLHVMMHEVSSRP